jgi:hypothetical protein
LRNPLRSQPPVKFLPTKALAFALIDPQLTSSNRVLLNKLATAVINRKELPPLISSQLVKIFKQCREELSTDIAFYKLWSLWIPKSSLYFCEPFSEFLWQVDSNIPCICPSIPPMDTINPPLLCSVLQRIKSHFSGLPIFKIVAL